MRLFSRPLEGHTKIEFADILGLYSLLRNGPLQDIHSLESGSDPPDFSLVYDGLSVGLEVRRVTFPAEVRNPQHGGFLKWPDSLESSFAWKPRSLRSVVDAVQHSLADKEGDLPRWTGTYDERWLALQGDYGFPGVYLGFCNLKFHFSGDSFKEFDNQRMHPSLARCLIELEHVVSGSQFDAVFLCGSHTAICLTKGKVVPQVPAISLCIQQLANAASFDWARHEIEVVERQSPLVLDGLVFAGRRVWNELRVHADPSG